MESLLRLICVCVFHICTYSTAQNGSSWKTVQLVFIHALYVKPVIKQKDLYYLLLNTCRVSVLDENCGKYCIKCEHLLGNVISFRYLFSFASVEQQMKNIHNCYCENLRILRYSEKMPKGLHCCLLMFHYTLSALYPIHKFEISSGFPIIFDCQIYLFMQLCVYLRWMCV